MPGGEGGLDIWRVRLTAAGLGGVENIGKPVNTEGDEMFPTFRPNGDLYFSSNGHPGMGGLDIYIAKVGNDRKYHLEHPGYPLNSQGDDFGMTFEGPHNRGFFSSNRGDGRGLDHIYSFENPEIIQTIKGWVYEMDGYELPAAQVYLVGNDGTNLKLSVKMDGSFEQVVEPGVDYVMLATCPGFLNHKEEISIKPTEKSEEHVLQFPLASIRVPVLIDNIFYDFDKATLRPESSAALDELVNMLQENSNITIELSAHADYRGSASYNKTLSQKRAESVVRYLIEHGVAKDRLTPVGYGKEKPKTIRRKVTEKYPWLKEDDVLTEEFIKQLHLLLKTGTSDSRKDWFAIGEYKRLPNEVGGMETTLPENVHQEMKALLKNYNSQKTHCFESILDFHVHFEAIHPFQDGNGRVGRLLMFKECLTNGIVPFIITDALKLFYYHGLREWGHINGYLTDTCLTAQDNYKVLLDYFKIKY